MMFNPYTGKPRHPSDIASDPNGDLIVKPDAPLKAAPKTNAERQAALKQRRKDAGLVSLKNVWVDPDDVPEMRVHAAKLARKRAKTEVRF